MQILLDVKKGPIQLDSKDNLKKIYSQKTKSNWKWHADSKESIQEVKKQYDDVSYVFDKFPIAAAEDITYILSGIPNNARINALDIGSGTGRSVDLLSDKFDNVTGIDLSSEMVDFASKRCSGKRNVSFYEMDVRELSLPKNSYDYIISHTALHHLVDDIQPTLFKIKDLLKPGGKILIIEMLAVGLMKYDPSFVRRIVASIILFKEIFTQGFQSASKNYMIATHPVWMTHLKKDKYYNRKYFKSIYGEVFPNAKYTEFKKEYGLNHLIMLEWTKP